VCFAVALLASAVLPIYPRRTLTRSQVVGHDGDVASFGFELSTLPGFFAERRYMRPEEYPTVTSIANVVIWISIAGSVALAGARFWSRSARKPPGAGWGRD
jgi:hypothetical protein